jgi:hypothetical protein
MTPSFVTIVPYTRGERRRFGQLLLIWTFARVCFARVRDSGDKVSRGAPCASFRWTCRAPHLPNLAPPQVWQAGLRGERQGPETVDDTDKGLSPCLIRQLANWHLEKFEEERLATGTVQQEALDTELRAVLADHGVFPEVVETEFERVMVLVFAPLVPDAGR